jgi:hypothetical protein
MIKQGLARFKLAQAYFFTTRALESIPTQREAFLYFIDAAIVFARSVTFCLKKEYIHKTGFHSWYLSKIEIMKKDPIFYFFLNKRNHILKVGSAGVYKLTPLTDEGKIEFSGLVKTKVIRIQPWYHRRLKILWEDLRAIIIKPIHGWLWYCMTKRKNLQFEKQSKVGVSENFFFDNPEWKNRPACDILQEYINKLEQIVAEAETRFDEKSL